MATTAHSYSTGQPTAKPEQTSLQEINTTLVGLHERAIQLASRMQTMGERAFGSVPEKEAGVSPTPVPNGELAGIRELLTSMARTFDRQDGQMAKLEKLV